MSRLDDTDDVSRSEGNQQVATVMPLGREAWHWVKAGGRPIHASMSSRFMYRWQSFWFERNASLQSRLPSSFEPKSDPVFVLGLWRSGTTLAHELLATAPGMLCPNTWQCLNPAIFRLVPQPLNGPKVKRPMDAMIVDLTSPQEDEFALLALGVPSVYRGFFDPRRLPELSRWLDPEQWSMQMPQDWFARWREFLGGVAQGRDGRLLLKSPNHSYRIRTLIEAFPKARFVWMARKPEDVFLSNRKMWVAMFERYALWNWDKDVLDDFLIKAFLRGSECLAFATNRLSRAQLMVVDFEVLSTSPMTSMEKLSIRLDLSSWVDIKDPLGKLIEEKRGYLPTTYPQCAFPDSILNAIRVLEETQQRALMSHG